MYKTLDLFKCSAQYLWHFLCIWSHFPPWVVDGTKHICVTTRSLAWGSIKGIWQYSLAYKAYKSQWFPLLLPYRHAHSCFLWNIYPFRRFKWICVLSWMDNCTSTPLQRISPKYDKPRRKKRTYTLEGGLCPLCTIIGLRALYSIWCSCHPQVTSDTSVAEGVIDVEAGHPWVFSEFLLRNFWAWAIEFVCKSKHHLAKLEYKSRESHRVWNKTVVLEHILVVNSSHVWFCTFLWGNSTHLNFINILLYGSQLSL